MGYGTETKEYWLYDEKYVKVLYSRNVLFNESSCGIQKESIEQEEKCYITIESKDEEIIVDEPSQPPVLRRSERERQPPDYYREQVSIINDKLKEPKTVKEALTGPYETQWLSAMENAFT